MKLTVMHDGLIRLVLKVAIPPRPEFRARPLVHHPELILSWSHLHTSLNAVGRQWASAIDIPLVENLFLYLRISSSEVIKGFNVRLSAEHGEGKVMILEVETNSWKIDERLNSGLAKLLRVTNTGALENERRTESTARNDDLLAGPNSPRLQLAGRKRFGGYRLNAYSLVALNDDLCLISSQF